MFNRILNIVLPKASKVVVPIDTNYLKATPHQCSENNVNQDNIRHMNNAIHELRCAEELFNSATEQHLIDVAIYQINAARSKIEYIAKQGKGCVCGK